MLSLCYDSSMKKYYEAYDQRYQIIHEKGHSWSSDTPTPIVYDVMQKYNLSSSSILETGCGEGRDALYLLKQGYGVTASDISAEAINYCKLQNPDYCGVNESVSDTSKAFDLVERIHESGIIDVTATSLRMINFNTFENEIISNNLSIIEKGITSSFPDFNHLMYAVVKKHE